MYPLSFSVCVKISKFITAIGELISRGEQVSDCRMAARIRSLGILVTVRESYDLFDENIA